MESHIWGTRARDQIAGAVMELIDDPSRIARSAARRVVRRPVRAGAGRRLCDRRDVGGDREQQCGVAWRAAP